MRVAGTTLYHYSRIGFLFVCHGYHRDETARTQYVLHGPGHTQVTNTASVPVPLGM